MLHKRSIGIEADEGSLQMVVSAFLEFLLAAQYKSCLEIFFM